MDEGNNERALLQRSSRRQGGTITSFILSYLYVIATSLLALKTMVETRVNKRIQVAFLTSIIITFIFLPGGHLITIVPKLLGSEGVRAAAGEVGAGHVEKYSFLTAVIGLAVTLVLTFFIGRALCGYGCPVGAVQELFYEVPTGKNGENKVILPTPVTYFIRVGMLGLLIVLYLGYGIDLIQLLAPYQMWRFDFVAPGIYILLAFFIASLFIYRPFCCLFCPYGAIAAIVAKFSLYKLENTETCTSCGLCESDCPTGEISQNYGECYLCGRCIQVCKTDSLKYR